MKISQISYPGFGGLNSVVFSLIAADSSFGYKWSIGFIGDQPLDKSFPKRCQDHGADFASFHTKLGNPFRAWYALARWLRHIAPDAVICHSISSILPCWLYSMWSGAKLIAVEHTSNQVKSSNDWIYSKLSMFLSDKVVVLTEEYRAELQIALNWQFRANKVTVIPNGINTALFYPKVSLNVSSSKLVRLGMASRFSLSKRQDLLVRVIDHLFSLYPQLIIQLAFAGDGSEFDRVQTLANASASPKRFRFDGSLPEEAMASWFRNLDIYVHATDGETLSISLLQAMATGLPIIASDISGVSNLLGEHQQYGVCVSNDVEAFALAILKLIDDPVGTNALGQRARSRILEQYDQKVMMTKFSMLIQSACC